MALDHGILNLPLDKRSKKFHAELDQYLAAKRQQERAQQKVISEKRKEAFARSREAKALLQDLKKNKALIKREADRRGVSRACLVDGLESIAELHPHRMQDVIDLIHKNDRKEQP